MKLEIQITKTETINLPDKPIYVCVNCETHNKYAWVVDENITKIAFLNCLTEQSTKDFFTEIITKDFGFELCEKQTYLDAVNRVFDNHTAVPF